LIGIDGASWKVIEPMLADGELPTFQRLVSQGATCPDVDVAHRSSPVAWTSIATGRLSQHHGILNHITKLPNGDLIPVTGANRRVKAI
jgi:predicted AlkP superfamily phosphohydrolase/phosphomutase